MPARLPRSPSSSGTARGGSAALPTFRTSGPILEATSTLVAATGILNVWINDPAETAAADAALRAERAGRFMLGIGIGHPEATRDYRRPLATMRSFLDGLDSSPTPPPAEQRCLAALGPKMLDLGPASAPRARIRTSCPSSTRGSPASGSARASSLRPELHVRPRHRSGARQSGGHREYAKLYLGLRNYTQNLLAFGFTEGDVAGGGSDRLINAVIPHGTAEQIAEVVRAHLDAGADHVCLQPLGEEGIPHESWTALAKVLID